MKRKIAMLVALSFALPAHAQLAVGVGGKTGADVTVGTDTNAKVGGKTDIQTETKADVKADASADARADAKAAARDKRNKQRHKEGARLGARAQTDTEGRVTTR